RRCSGTVGSDSAPTQDLSPERGVYCQWRVGFSLRHVYWWLLVLCAIEPGGLDLVHCDGLPDWTFAGTGSILHDGRWNYGHCDRLWPVLDGNFSRPSIDDYIGANAVGAEFANCLCRPRRYQRFPDHLGWTHRFFGAYLCWGGSWYRVYHRADSKVGRTSRRRYEDSRSPVSLLVRVHSCRDSRNGGIHSRPISLETHYPHWDGLSNWLPGLYCRH